MTESKKAKRSWVADVALVCFVFYMYFVVRHFLEPVIMLPTLQMPWLVIARTYPLFIFALLHCVYMRGWKNGVAFAALVVVVAWLGEQCSTSCGFPFGLYSYTPQMGWKLGNVPYEIPFDYFSMMVYPGYIFTNLILENKYIARVVDGGQVFLVSLFTSIMVIAYDAFVDPVDATERGQWLWTHQSDYFGIPYSNYGGYILEITIMMLIYHWVIEKRIPAKSLGPVPLWLALLPIIFFCTAWIDYTFGAGRGLMFIGFFSVGVPTIIALNSLNRIYRHKHEIEINE